MKLEEYKKDSYEFTKSASDLVRQFAFAGIGIIWIFKYEKPIDHLIPVELFKPLLFLIITLALDLLQYLLPSIIWTIFYKYHEKKGRNNDYELKANKWYSRPGWLFYYGKIITLSVAYILITNFILNKI
jgi:hypothetical protein